MYSTFPYTESTPPGITPIAHHPHHQNVFYVLLHTFGNAITLYDDEDEDNDVCTYGMVHATESNNPYPSPGRSTTFDGLLLLIWSSNLKH